MDINETVVQQLKLRIASDRPLTPVPELNGVLRLMAKWRSQIIANTLIQQHGQTILHGPFAGMTYVKNATEGALAARLLGAYESELHPHIQALVDEAPDCVIDVGCAEGYYAVGLARLMPETTVHAYDIDARARTACAELAQANGVADRVVIGERFAPDGFQAFADRRCVVMVDVEGAELDVLQPDQSPALAGMSIIVETHDHLQPGALATLTARFSTTHDIVRVDQGGKTTPLPAWLKGLGHLDHLLAVWEWRETPTPWLVMRPKIANPAARRAPEAAATVARGEPAPWFTAPTESLPDFDFSSLGGQYVLIGFMPLDDQARAGALRVLAAHQPMFDDARLTAFAVLRDAATIAQVRDQPGLRWILDRDGAVSRLYGAVDADGSDASVWVLLDPTLRVLATAPVGAEAGLFAALPNLPPPQDHARTPLSAPALIVPRIFEPDLCARLIALYETTGGRASGVMRDIDGKTMAVMDAFKQRRDVLVAAQELRAELRDALRRRLVPEIAKAFCFEATRIERYLVSCYDAAEGGVFRAHRDNTTRVTAHRRFAVSINLNSDDFEGGDLRFPEYGLQTYRPPTGGAVVFACGLLHEALPVTAGRRFAFLPFLYDETGAAIREANQIHRGDQREGAAGLTALEDDRLSAELS